MMSDPEQIEKLQEQAAKLRAEVAAMEAEVKANRKLEPESTSSIAPSPAPVTPAPVPNKDEGWLNGLGALFDREASRYETATMFSAQRCGLRMVREFFNLHMLKRSLSLDGGGADGGAELGAYCSKMLALSGVPHLEYVARPKGRLAYAWPNRFTRPPLDAPAKERTVLFAASINLTHPSAEQAAALRRCRPMVCTLQPGETLLLPAYWHHEVHSRAAGESEGEQPLNVAVNHWFRNETASPECFG